MIHGFWLGFSYLSLWKVKDMANIDPGPKILQNFLI